MPPWYIRFLGTVQTVHLTATTSILGIQTEQYQVSFLSGKISKPIFVIHRTIQKYRECQDKLSLVICHGEVFSSKWFQLIELFIFWNSVNFEPGLDFTGEITPFVYITSLPTSGTARSFQVFRENPVNLVWPSTHPPLTGSVLHG